MVVGVDIDSNRTVYHDEDCCVHSAADRPGNRHRARFRPLDGKDHGRQSDAGETIDGVRSESPTQAIGDLQANSADDGRREAGQRETGRHPGANRRRCWQESRSHRQHRPQDRQHALFPADGAGQRQRADGRQKVRRPSRTRCKKFPTVLDNVSATPKKMGDAMAAAKRNSATERVHRLHREKRGRDRADVSTRPLKTSTSSSAISTSSARRSTTPTARSPSSPPIRNSISTSFARCETSTN